MRHRLNSCVIPLAALCQNEKVKDDTREWAGAQKPPVDRSGIRDGQDVIGVLLYFYLVLLKDKLFVVSSRGRNSKVQYCT
jgi:hypothetical protein